MPSSYTSSLRLTLPATGELSGTWGTTVNTGITELTDAAIAGYVSIAMTDADYTLTVANGATDQARRMMLNMTGTLTAARNVICPTASKLYIIKNATTGGYAITLKTSAGTGISIPNGSSMLLMCNGTDVVDAVTQFSNGAFTNLSYTGTLTGGTGVVNLGSGQFYKDASGNVGIGTATPGAKLDIASGNLSFSGSAQRIIGDFSNATLSNTPLFQTSTTNGGTNIGVIPNGTNTNASIRIFNNSDANNAGFAQLIANSGQVRLQADKVGTGSYLPITFYTSGSERVQIDASGNVGIGNAAPTERLDVTGNFKLSGSATFSGGTANGVAYLNGSKVLTTGSALTFDGATLNVSNSTGGVFAADSSVSNVFRGLQFKAAGSLFGYLQANSNTGELRSYIGPSPAWGGFSTWYIDNSEQMRLTSTGLGIGTSSPSYKLDVNGVGKFVGGIINTVTPPTTSISGLTQTNGTQTSNVMLTGPTYNFSGVGANEAWFYNDAGNVNVGPYAAYSLKLITNGLARATIDSSGNLGIGTSSPSVKLHAVTTGISDQYYFDTTSTSSGVYALAVRNTATSGSAIPTLALRQWRTSFAGSGNVGELRFDGLTTTGSYSEFASIYATATGANSSTGAATALIFNTSAGASNATERMRLDSSGNLGIGVTPTDRLNVSDGTVNFQVKPIAASSVCFTGTRSNHALAFNTNDTERARITSGGDLLVGTATADLTAGAGVKIKPGTDGTMGIVGATSTDTSFAYHLYSTGAAAYRFYVGYGGTVYATNTTISSLSDQRLKENVQDLDVGLDKIMALKPRKFDWKAGKGKDIKGDRGFIAQEFEQVFPDLIDEWKDPAPEGEEPYKSVRADLIPVLVKAIQEQQALITDLRARVAALEA